MSEASSEKQVQYNRVAKKYSEKLVQYRAGVREKSGATARPVESLFPDFNKVGLGVHLEYSRMGNQPVTDELQGRAEALNIDFEHLGLTLGTVLHNVDLKDPVTPELVAFIRDTLLERKVIFFRDQHLTEDEQVSFGRMFGDLDAFPFGKPGNNPFILEISHSEQSPGAENSFWDFPSMFAGWQFLQVCKT